jgi:hypothetical protein
VILGTRSPAQSRLRASSGIVLLASSIRLIPLIVERLVLAHLLTKLIYAWANYLNTTAWVPAMLLKARDMDQVLHIAAVVSTRVDAHGLTISSLILHHLLLEIVGRFHLAQNSVKGDRTEFNWHLNIRLLEVDKRLILFLVHDDTTYSFKSYSLIHSHFSVIEYDQLHQSFHNCHTIVRLAGDGVGSKRKFKEVRKLNQFFKLMELRNPVRS